MDFRSLFDEEFLDGVRRDVSYEVRMVVKTLGEQISNAHTSNRSTHEESQYYFSTRFYQQAETLGLTEADAVDVFTNGHEVKEGTIVREFNGYELGIEYIYEQLTGKPVITSVWRRNITA